MLESKKLFKIFKHTKTKVVHIKINNYAQLFIKKRKIIIKKNEKIIGSNLKNKDN